MTITLCETPKTPVVAHPYYSIFSSCQKTHNHSQFNNQPSNGAEKSLKTWNLKWSNSKSPALRNLRNLHWIVWPFQILGSWHLSAVWTKYSANKLFKVLSELLQRNLVSKEKAEELKRSAEDSGTRGNAASSESSQPTTSSPPSSTFTESFSIFVFSTQKCLFFSWQIWLF